MGKLAGNELSFKSHGQHLPNFQLTITCSNSTIKTLEKGVKSGKS